MKISYRREMKHNYLIIDPEALIWRNYECRMLAGNTIDGVLRFQLRQVDDEIRFYYEITSRQPLSRMLEGRLIRGAEIRHLVLGISGILDRMEQYLLREGSVLLDPEYIYVDPETFRIWLCLVPGLDRDFPKDYGKLLEYLLGKVDHQDKETVVLAYGLYQETRKENYGMEDILRLLWPVQEKCEEVSEYEEKEQESRITDQTQNEDVTHDRMIGKWGRESGSRELEFDKRKKKDKKGFWARLCRWIRSVVGRTRESEADSGSNDVIWKDLFREESRDEHQKTVFKDERQRQDHIEVSQEEYREAPLGRNTALLADLSLDSGAGNRWLRALDLEMEDIEIGYCPFVIGKQENLADYLLQRETVSRLHVRIDQRDDKWMIQDLNSTNGTMVAGKLLENNESAEIHIGDEVRIAEFRYQFV